MLSSTKKAKIREIFKSIQGEGSYVGTLQVFIRFCGCNLKCSYCDTDFEISKAAFYSPDELMTEIEKFSLPDNTILSLTGGEPLLSVDFLEDFLPIAKSKKYKIYLETNATLPDNLQKVLNWVDIISADIKLESAVKQKLNFTETERFFKLCSGKDVFAKIVFDKNITDDEIDFAAKLACRCNFNIVLQPMMTKNGMSVTSEFCEKVFEKFYTKYHNVRLIPQTHKFLDLR